MNDPLRLYDYLEVARARVLESVRALDEAAYRREHPIGLGSIARTLHHLRAAEGLYMARVRGELGPLPPPAPADDPEVEAPEALAFPALEAAWADLAARTRRDLAAVEDWTTPRRVETAWEGRRVAYDASPADYLTQLVVHEAHHRAQVLHMLRREGVIGPGSGREAPEVDFNALMWTFTEVPDEA